MADLELRKYIGKIWNEDQNERRKNCAVLYELYEGAIAKHVNNRIKGEIRDPKERQEIASRILEVELVKRIVEKLARAYNKSPTRRIVNGNEQDQQILEWYLKNINFNDIGYKMDKNYCNYKEALLKPYFNYRTMKPAVKVLEPVNYIAVSTDKQDNSIPTIFAEYYGIDTDKRDLLLCVSEDELWIQYIDGELATTEMNSIENLDGINIYNKINMVYSKNANSAVMPYPDESMISVATLIPMLCGDINYAIKYMSYAIIWGVNVKEELVKRGPNAFFNLMPNDENSPNKPEVGVLKPDIDIAEVFDGIMLQLQLWLNSRGISSTVVGSNAGSVSSGISKMIDEADVSGIITKNQDTYKTAEAELFDFILHYAHDIWKNENPEIPQQVFSPSCYVETTFPTVEVIKSRNEILDELAKELKDGLVSKKRAIKRLNPNMNESEIEELIQEIIEERSSKPIADSEITNNMINNGDMENSDLES